MKYFKFLTLFLLSFLFAACGQDSGKQAVQKPSVFENKQKTPLEETISKVENTVIIEPLRSLEGNTYFYNMKQSLSRALENSTQKEIFYACNDFKKTLTTTLQMDYSTDFVTGTWQRTEVEKLAQDVAKEQCADIHLLRALLLTDLQSAVNVSESQEEFKEKAKPIIENYASKVLEKTTYYVDIFHKLLAPYKKVRQAFYPLELAGYNTYILEQNDFAIAKKIVTPFLQGTNENIDEEKVNKLISRADKEEKVLFVFLKQYDSLMQTQGNCIKQFFPGLKEKWYDFMYEIEKLPADKRQAYADKRFKQAKDGLQSKCPNLYEKAKKPQNNLPQGQAPEQANVASTPEETITNSISAQTNNPPANMGSGAEEPEEEYYF